MLINLFRKVIFYSGIICLLTAMSCSSNNSFEILYYSNLNGNIEACDCYEVMLGGLHQIKPVVDNLRKKNQNLIFIDGGDTFSSYSFIELDQAVFKAYQLIKPDIWIPGEQEFIEGKNFFKTVIDSMDTFFLTGNIAINNANTQSIKKYKLNNKTIMITSYIQTDVLLKKYHDLGIVLRKDNPIQRINPDNFNILVFHGDEMALAKEKSIISGFDLILTAHQQSADIDLKRATPMIGGGADGEFLVHIILQENDSGFKISATKINIEQSDKPDQEIAKIISEYRNKIGLTN